MSYTENPESRKYRRRKRNRAGATWTPPSMSADSADGRYCKACGVFHGYMTLGVSYEKRGEAWVLNWYCRKTGDYVGELWLGDTDGKET